MVGFRLGAVGAPWRDAYDAPRGSGNPDAATVDVIRASESASVETSRSMPLAPPIPQQRHAGRQQPLIQSLQDQVGGPQKPLADIEKQAAERLKVAAPAEPLKNEQHKEGAASPVLRIAL